MRYISMRVWRVGVGEIHRHGLVCARGNGDGQMLLSLLPGHAVFSGSGSCEVHLCEKKGGMGLELPPTHTHSSAQGSFGATASEVLRIPGLECSPLWQCGSLP